MIRGPLEHLLGPPERPTFCTPWGEAQPLSIHELHLVQLGRLRVTKAVWFATLLDYEQGERGYEGATVRAWNQMATVPLTGVRRIGPLEVRSYGG